MYLRPLGKMAVALTGITFFAASPASTLRAQELVRVEATRFSSRPPTLVVSGGLRCNLDGDLYLVYSESPQALTGLLGRSASLPIRRVSIGDGTTIEYPIPSIPRYLQVVRNDYDIGPHGQLYALLFGGRKNPQTGAEVDDFLIAKYSADGTLASYVKLAGAHGKDLAPIRLGAFADGRFLVVGMRFDERLQGSAFAAVFDSGGNLVSQLSVPDDITPMPFSQATPPPNPDLNRHPMPAVTAVSETRIAGAPDGNVYLLWGTVPQRLYIVSPDGDVTRQFEVPATKPGMRALTMGPAGLGNIFLAFGAVGKFVPSGERGARPLTVLDASTGQVTAAYDGAQGEDSMAIAACATSPHDFLFVRPSEDRKNLLVVHYSAPGF